MKHTSRVSAGLVAIGLFAAHQAEAQPNEFIHTTVLTRAGLSVDAIEKMVSGRILLKAANDCYTINPSLSGGAPLDIESARFVDQLRAWAGETAQIRVCDVNFMRPGTQDFVPVE